MLGFFRKYQKIVFVLVTVVVAVSFSFFGTYGAMGGRENEEKDSPLGTAMDGSVMSKRDIDRMVRFLSTDRHDVEMLQRGNMPNYFNDGVIRKDLLGSGVGQMLVEAYFDVLSSEIETRLERTKRFHPYKHPQADFVSAESMWGQFVPRINEALKEVKGCDESLKGFNLLSELYLEEGQFPPYLLRRFLAYQQNQHQWLQKDPMIQNGDLALFQFHSLDDWFGDKFIQLSCQFIHNVALHAKMKGYKVTPEEARAELLRSGAKALKEQQGSDISNDTLTKAWRHQLSMLNMDDNAAVEIWQKVLLFRRLFDDVGTSVVLDRLTYENYHAFASQSCEVEEYHLPVNLHLTKLRDVFLLEKYLELVAPGQTHALGLPENLLSVKEVQKRAPELLHKEYLVEMGSVDKAIVGLDVGLREMWEWQTANWDLLGREFRQLNEAPESERMAALDGLGIDMRKKIDSFSREKIVEEHPEWVIDALADVEMKEQVIVLPLTGTCAQLPGINDVRKVMDLLDCGDQKALEQYTQDGRYFHRIALKEKMGDLSIASFIDAKASGVLGCLLDKHLEKQYDSVRTAYPVPFRKDDDSWKPFADVSLEVGRYHYAEMLKGIETAYRKSGGKLINGSLKEDDSFYANYRLLGVVEKAMSAIASGDASQLDDNRGQWKIEKEIREVKRNESGPWSDDRLFNLQIGEFSEVVVDDATGEVRFCRVLKKCGSDAQAVVKDIKKGQELIADDAKRNFMTEILESVKEKDCIHFERRTP
jgi:GcvH upstream region-like protein